MKKSIIISLHVAFWFITIFSHSFLTIFIHFGSSLADISLASRFAPLLAPIFFYIFYLSIFSLLKNKKILIFSAVLVPVIVFALFKINNHTLAYSIVFVSNLITYGIIGSLFRFFVDWLNKDKIQLQLSRQNLQSELALLRTQINPHFLFNSLHNIDTLILVNPEKASDSLIKLSELMRYTLYDADTEFIELSKEIDYINKYINLQELRLTNKSLISFTVEGSVESIKVAPMLFISFIENAFKHATDKEVEAGISIQFKITEHRILFNVTNAFDATKNRVKDETSGIGLENVRRRLELIYPNNHKLEISTKDNRYKVELTINK
jgi:two-component system, LytTR family, sensor kinase